MNCCEKSSEFSTGLEDIELPHKKLKTDNMSNLQCIGSLQVNALIVGHDFNYVNFLNDMKFKLKSAQLRATLTVNKELITFYWQLCNELSVKQKQFKWGSQVLEKFSLDMQQAFPEMQGFSVSNIKRMRIFAMEYPDLTIGAQAVHQLPWGI